jgi:hypothetical protein
MVVLRPVEPDRLPGAWVARLDETAPAQRRGACRAGFRDDSVQLVDRVARQGIAAGHCLSVARSPFSSEQGAGSLVLAAPWSYRKARQQRVDVRQRALRAGRRQVQKMEFPDGKAQPVWRQPEARRAWALKLELLPAQPVQKDLPVELARPMQEAPEQLGQQQDGARRSPARWGLPPQEALRQPALQASQPPAGPLDWVQAR